MARKKKVLGTATVTRIAMIGNLELNKWKAEELDTIASRLGQLRTDLWNEYGSLKAWGVSEYEIDLGCVLQMININYQQSCGKLRFMT